MSIYSHSTLWKGAGIILTWQKFFCFKIFEAYIFMMIYWQFEADNEIRSVINIKIDVFNLKILFLILEARQIFIYTFDEIHQNEK